MYTNKLLCFLKWVFFCSATLPALANSGVLPSGSMLLPQGSASRDENRNKEINLTVGSRKMNVPDGGDSIFIRQIRIINSSIFDNNELHSLVASDENKKHNLKQLNDIAGKVSSYYKQHGYMVSRAYIPEQLINDGVLYIHVVEARLNKVKVNNLSRLSSGKIDGALKELHAGDFVSAQNINSSLLLLDDFAGVNVNGVLEPSDKVGSSDLIVNVEPGEQLNGSFGIDNYGSRYIGYERYNAILKVNNPATHGDQVVINVLTTGRNLTTYHAGYRLPIDVKKTIGADISGMRYVLKNDLGELNANGSQKSASIWGGYLWLRDFNTRFESTITYTRARIIDEIGAISKKKSRALDSIVLGNSIDLSDKYGRTFIYVSGTLGDMSFDNFGGKNEFILNHSSTEDVFLKGNIRVARMQQLTDTSSIYISLDGQVSSVNLDESEKLTLGGPFAVRSYDVGIVSGDQGYFSSVEFRKIIANRRDIGIWTPVVFFDIGHVQINKTPFINEDNYSTLSSVGLGLDIDWKYWLMTTRYAHSIGASLSPILSQTVDNNKIWMQVNLIF